MFSIGEFSRIARVTPRQLRFYDGLGLLVPDRVDAHGRRHYAAAQLARLHRILALKDLGFPLEQIRPLLDEDGPSVEELRGMLRLRQAESERRLRDERRRHRAIRARLDHLERAGRDDPFPVVLKAVPRLRWLSVRAVVASPEDAGALFDRVARALSGPGFGPQDLYLGVVHSPLEAGEGFDEDGFDVEAGRVVASGRAPAVPDAAFAARDLAAVEEMATVIHEGPPDALFPAYGALGNWLERAGYRLDGPSRELLLRAPSAEGARDAVTEVQFPVRPVRAEAAGAEPAGGRP